MAFCFDFAAAFPSIEHSFMHKFFTRLKWPNWLLRCLTILYQGNYCNILIGGGHLFGFPITRGIRQGCPLSPLLFAAASDLLIRRLFHHIPSCICRAYADDLAAVVPNGSTCLPTLEDIFREFQAISGLRLNVAKTVLMPLSAIDTETLRLRLAREVLNWEGILVQRHAKYLGFVIGTGRKDFTWEQLVRKYLERARVWRSLKAGMLQSIEAYKTYILPVLSFVGQLDELPYNFLDIDRQACSTLFSGPYRWITPGFLKELKVLKFPQEIPSMIHRAKASNASGAFFENLSEGGLSIPRRANALIRLCQVPDNAIRVAQLGSWIQTNFIYNLDTAVCEIREAKSRKHADLYVPTNQQADLGERAGWHASATKLLKEPTSALHTHRDRRARRWPCATLPGRRLPRCVKSLSLLSKLVPPRVVAARLRAILNGWTTARRFQSRASCIFQCQACAPDDIEHYAHCKALKELNKKLLRLAEPDTTYALDCFLGFRLDTNTLPAHLKDAQDAEEVVCALFAISSFALFRTHALAKTREISGAVAKDIFREMIHDAVRDHAKAIGILKKLWTVPSCCR